MPSISFTQLEVQKRTGNSYDLIMNFDVEPTPDPKNPSVNLQYAIYDEHNQLLTTMVLGKRSYTIGSGVYPKITTTSKKVRVDAWLTGDTLVRTYDVLTTTGAKEFNIISNIVSHTLSLTSGTGFKRGQAYQAPAVTEEVTVDAPQEITLDSIVSGITQAVTVQEAAAEEEFKTKWYMVTFPSGKIEERKVSQKFIDTMSARGWKFEPIIDEPPPEQKETWWVIRPSGIIEQVRVTQKFVDTMSARGWKFSKEKPAELEPINADISVIFSSGTGGDLKTHFNFSSLIIDLSLIHISEPTRPY